VNEYTRFKQLKEDVSKAENTKARLQGQLETYISKQTELGITDSNKDNKLSELESEITELSTTINSKLDELENLISESNSD